jgi:pSer/pThr/pTyr-binding forkhead associated (FHA) protein
LAFYFAGTAKQVAVATDEEFILGRIAEGDAEPMVDLTYPDGFAMGVSRRHAKVRSTANGYMITDLNSSNGTWLDGKILPPSQPVELPNGCNVQLGRLKLVAIYNSPPSKNH